MGILLLIVALATTALTSPSGHIFSSKVSPELQTILSKQINTNVFVTLKNDTSEILSYVQATNFVNRNDRLNAMHNLLVEHAAKTQERVINVLKLHNAEFESFWINNQIVVKNPDFSLIVMLDELDEVGSMDEEKFGYLMDPVENKNATITKGDPQWGIVKIQAPEAWNALGNNDGKGVRVATIDTGVRLSHEALKNNFAGEYGWFDPGTLQDLPTDNNGHGTHTTGTIAGSGGIGVAPGATWMACRGCQTSACSQYDLNRCGQFFACPTLTDGHSEPDCTKAPHVVSNSWGGGRGATWYEPVMNAWVAAGIIPVFSIGNSGPNCNTANSPGDNTRVIGVGSTMLADTISSFSSIGPAILGHMKPDITAPGSEVISAYHLADDAYRSLSGTSMAAPHVSGTIALLLARNSTLSVESIRQLLFQNTDRQLTFSGKLCEGIPDDTFPNHIFGNGRLNAYKSVLGML